MTRLRFVKTWTLIEPEAASVGEVEVSLEDGERIVGVETLLDQLGYIKSEDKNMREVFVRVWIAT